MLGLCIGVLVSSAMAGEKSDASKPSRETLIPGRNFAMKTFGGRQYWADVLFFHDWRIQKNVFTNHHRLLDGKDFRHASGSLEKCRAELERIKKANKLPPMTGKAVVLVHGMVRSSKSFAKLRVRLQQEGYQVFAFDYPSTRVEIPKSAEFLHTTIGSLEGIDEINFVVHSMGGLVVRSYLAKHRDKRIRRMVMMGVPNLGAKLADRLKENLIYKTVFGPAGQQLHSDSEGLIAKLPTPDFEFGVLAGGKGTIAGYNPLIPGDDDGTVGVASTRLPGATDFATVRCLHSFLMSHNEATDYTVHFLMHGRFRKKGEPHPIPRRQEKKASPNEKK